MQLLKKYSSHIIVASFLLCYFSFFFGEVILSPNKYVLGLDSDALKNYYTFAFQVRHEGSSFHFSGMNYPFGEHVLYTDGMPLLGFVVGLCPFLKGYEVGIFHYFLFLSVIVGAFLWLRIFRHLKINDYLAAAGCISIVIMSPQMYRINGHFSLSLMWVLPLVVFLLLQWVNTNQKVKYAIYLALGVFMVFFAHPYLGLMSFMMASASFLCFWLWKRVNFKAYLIGQGIVAMALLFFMVVLKLSDNHQGRTAVPGGFFENFGYLETTFVPVLSPLKPVMEFFFPIIHGQPWEAWAYIGCLTLLVLIAGAAIMLTQKIRRKSSSLIIDNDPLPPLFFASIMLLLFSYQIPLKWFSEEFIFSLKVFNQFRSLGRFAWVFFYVAQLYAWVLLDRMIINKKFVTLTFACIVPAMAIIESYQMHQMVFDHNKLGLNPLNGKNIQNDKDLNKVIEIIGQDKQALILPLPFFHLGSERVSIDVANDIKKMSFITSFHTGSPLIASSMSRTSVSEARTILQMFNSDFGEIVNQFLRKKIWILTNNESLFFNQKELLEAATLKYKSDRVRLYLFDYAKFALGKKKNFEDRKFKIAQAILSMNGFQLSDSSFFLVNNYESEVGEHVFAGKGSRTVPQNQYTILAEIPSLGDLELDASFWNYIGFDKAYTGLVVVEEQDTLSKSGAWLTTKDVSQFTVFERDWEFVEMKIPMRKGPYIYRLFLLGAEDETKTFTIDNLVIRPSLIDVKTTQKDWCPAGKEMFNNVPIK